MQKSKYTYPDGSKYIGEFKDGKRHGKGVLIRPNGVRYIGKWQNNKPHGRGTVTAPDGRKRIGEWENGKLVKEIQTSINQNQNIKKLEEGDAGNRSWIRNEETKDPNKATKKPSDADKEPAKSNDATNAVVSLIIVGVFVVLAVLSTTGRDEDYLDDLTPQELIQFIIEVERRENR